MSEPLDIDKDLEDGRKPGNQTFFKNDTKNLLVVTRGHPFERDNFFNMIDSLGFDWSHIEHPAAQSFFKKENLKAIYKIEDGNWIYIQSFERGDRIWERK